jgi:small subunit ribosomal protein S3
LGQKVHPVGFRLGYVKPWQAKWFDERNYAQLLKEDWDVRKLIFTRHSNAGVAQVDIERSANQITATIHTARPGIIIGRSGANVEELRQVIERETGKKVRINIQEVRQPEVNAVLVARNVADQLEKRVAFRRAMKQSVQRAMERGAKGVRISVAGRLGGSEMSRREQERRGRVPLHTLRADIDFGTAEALTTYGVIGIKCWIYKGDILPERATPAPVAVPRTTALASDNGAETKPAAAVQTEAEAPVEAILEATDELSAVETLEHDASGPESPPAEASEPEPAAESDKPAEAE